MNLRGSTSARPFQISLAKLMGIITGISATLAVIRLTFDFAPEVVTALSTILFALLVLSVAALVGVLVLSMIIDFVCGTIHVCLGTASRTRLCLIRLAGRVFHR